MARAGGLLIGIKLFQKHLQPAILEDKVCWTCETTYPKNTVSFCSCCIFHANCSRDT